MPVLGLLSYTLEIPDLESGIRFYTDAGLTATHDDRGAVLKCPDQDRASIILIGDAERKRLHHIHLRADRIDEIAAKVVGGGGQLLSAPDGFDEAALWLSDPHGTIYCLSEHAEDPAPTNAPVAFEINGPGRIIRKHRSAILPRSAYPPVKPLRLGHILLFTPDVMASVAFVSEVFGLGLADRAQDIIAFTCARADSDHHLIAFAKSDGPGFHHASFQVGDPDEVGRGGQALLSKSGLGSWGFGRHTIGSNFFHYIQDPWGSWFEYYSDMDYIEDYSAWTPTNYAMEDALASWGPEVPRDFVHNYEVDETPFSSLQVERWPSA